MPIHTNLTIMLMVSPNIVPIMMQRDRIELLKRVGNLTARRRQPRVQRHTLHPTRRQIEPLVLAQGGPVGVAIAQIDGVRLFDVAEVDGVDAAALVGDDGGFGVAE